MALSLSSAPATEPVTLAEVKAHLRVDHTADNDYIEDFIIPAARRLAETMTHRAFITQTWILRLQGFGLAPIYLPRPPLVSITSVAYTDTAGDSGTFSSGATGYLLEQPSGEQAQHASIRPAYSVSYPSTRDIVDSVVITYVAGYGAASAVPKGIKQAVFMLTEDLYQNRASQVIGKSISTAAMTAEMLLKPFVVSRFGLRFD
jgi:uncharacterized phiE125 gp8 family phage protein